MHIYEGNDIDLASSGYISLTHDTCLLSKPWISFEISSKHRQHFVNLDLKQVDQLIDELTKCRDTVRKFYGVK